MAEIRITISICDLDLFFHVIVGWFLFSRFRDMRAYALKIYALVNKESFELRELDTPKLTNLDMFIILRFIRGSRLSAVCSSVVHIANSIPGSYQWP